MTVHLADSLPKSAIAQIERSLEGLPDDQRARPNGALHPALLVKPPKGLEVGYVPIATRQEDAGK